MKSENRTRHRITATNVDRVWNMQIHEPYDYRDGDEFRSYRDEIQQLLIEHKRLSVPEIHRLVAKPKREWTMDALELMNVIEKGVCPVKYELFGPGGRQI